MALAAAALFCAVPLRPAQRLPGIVVNGRVALELLGVGSLRAGAGKARIALGQFIARFPRYELAARPERSKRARFRGFTRMPLKLR